MPHHVEPSLLEPGLADSSSCAAPVSLDGVRLLFVVNVAWFFLSHRLPIAQAALAAGMKVSLAADVVGTAEIEAVEGAGIEFHRIRLARSGMRPSQEVSTVLQLARTVQRIQPSIVHNVTAKPVIYGSLVAKLLRVRGIVNAVAGFGHAYGDAAERRKLAALMDRAYGLAFRGNGVRVIVQNVDDEVEVRRICPTIESCVRRITGSGVDLAVFTASPEPDGPPIVVLPARMLREKGVEEFCTAAAVLRGAGVDARFVLAGRLDPGNRTALTESELRSLCDRSGAEWLGDCCDMPALLRNSNIVCLPTYYREGVPKVLLEACASQRAVVTTNVSGCREVVRSGVNGILVEPRAVTPLAVALRTLIENPTVRRGMGAAGRRRAEREFDVRAVARQHLEIYAELAGRRSGI